MGNIETNETSSIRRLLLPPARLDLLGLKVVIEKEFTTNLQQQRAASFLVAPSSSSK